MKELIRQLCGVPGLSGFEDEIRAFIAEKIRPHVQELKVDSLGNLIARKKGRRRTESPLMIAAHMDEVGLIVKKVDDKGYIRFAPTGGIDRRTLLGKKVLVGKGRIPGVVGLKAVHLVSPKEEKTIPEMARLYIDIGASGKEEAQSLVRTGDPVLFHSDWVEYGDGRIKAKALDDRVGCAAMIRLIQSDLPMDCVFVFTAQEEVGARGAAGAAFSLRPSIALILEGTTAADLPGVKEHRQVTRLGAGPVLGLMDRQTIYDRKLFELLRDLAVERGIPWQTKRTIAGGTDASSIQPSGRGVRMAALSVPVRYIHTPSSTASLKDCEQLYTLAEGFLEALAGHKEDL